MGRDALSDALRQRLDTLPKNSTRFTPEILHLLLELSDQPVKKSHLSALDRLRTQGEDPGPRLKWEDIAREDGWAEAPDIWETVDFADNSEEEVDVFPHPLSQASDSDTSMSSVTAPGQRIAKDLILPDSGLNEQPEQAGTLLSRIEEAQEWRQDAQPRDASGRPTKTPVSEYQILRESLWLLNGLPTSLFAPDCTPVPKYQLINVSWDTYRAMVNSFAEYGRTLLPLRKFCETIQDVPLVQTFQGSVIQCLRIFDKHIALLQGRYVHIKEDTVVSLIALQEELKPHLVPLAGLSNVVRKLQEERYAHSFRFLELLYHATCIAQLSGDEHTYSYLGEIFFDCFRVYIRPIRQWMEEGELTPGDKTFFVAESSTSVPMHQIWSDKFKLRRSDQGQLHAPRFLQPAVRRIFNTGKSVVVLKHLGRFQHPTHLDASRLPEPPLDFAPVCGSPDLALAPFSELFDSAFDRWVQSKHLSTSSNLQAILFESCGLWTSLDVLEHIYFMSDGALADTFVSPVFAGLDSESTTWTDRFTLTELAQEAWSPCPSLEGYRLSASVEREPDSVSRSRPISVRRSVRISLPGLRLSYRLAWPVQLVITRETVVRYQTLFTLLLQLRRAASILTTSAPSLKLNVQAEMDGQQAAYYGLRTRLLWFTATVHSYLTTLVLTPEITKMRNDLQAAEDLDGMIEVHAAFTKRILEEACLGPKLAPIRECVLDVLDLAVRLEDARRTDQEAAARWALLSTPQRRFRGANELAVPEPQSALRGVYVSPREKEREEDQIILFGDDEEEEGDHTSGSQKRSGTRGGGEQKQTYPEILTSIRADFDRHLRFVAGGLRGVARASTDAAAAKWDVLAEMLEMGLQDGSR